MRLYDTNLTFMATRFSGPVESNVIAGVQANESKIVVALPELKTLVVITDPLNKEDGAKIVVSNAMQDSGFRFMVNHQTTGHVFPLEEKEEYRDALSEFLPEISNAITTKLGRFGISGVTFTGNKQDESTGYAQ